MKTATTRFGSSFEMEDLNEDGRVERIRIDGGSEVTVLHKAPDQGGFDGGWVCLFEGQTVIIDEEALKYE